MHYPRARTNACLFLCIAFVFSNGLISTGLAFQGFATLDPPPTSSFGPNNGLQSPTAPGQWDSVIPDQAWNQNELPQFTPDPLLEKQLKYSPPEDEIEGILLEANEASRSDLSILTNDRYIDYRSQESAVTFLPGSDDQFGWLSLESQPYVAKGYRSGVTTAIDIHWLTGPNSVALPPRLYDFILGYQWRAPLSKRISVDLATNIGVFSDFEDSARDGIRFPSHGVGMYRWNKNTDLVLGVDYLSRDDIKILPVFGLSWRNPNRPNWRFDLVFPRPRIDYMLSSSRRLYVAGQLGGGSWDIEFPDNSNDVMTYRDYRLLIGYERVSSNGDRSGFEMGYVFDRELEFRGQHNGMSFDDAFVIRFVKRN